MKFPNTLTGYRLEQPPIGKTNLSAVYLAEIIAPPTEPLVALKIHSNVDIHGLENEIAGYRLLKDMVEDDLSQVYMGKKDFSYVYDAEIVDAETKEQIVLKIRSHFELHHLENETTGYRLVKDIGENNLSQVYEAKIVDPAQKQRVALKRIFNPANIRHLQNEFTLLKGLQHPNLPRYYHLFEESGEGYLVMEFVPGKNLKKVLAEQKGPLSEVLVVSYAVQLCNVLSYLHHKKIVHRDIKPANIIITPRGLIKLVDFGLFKQGDDTIQPGLTTTYAPPEQWQEYQGDFGHTDQRSDIYSLGATFYHLLSTKRPLSFMKRVAKKEPLQPLPDYISSHVASAIMKAMALRKDARYTNAQEFLSALLSEELASNYRSIYEISPSPPTTTAQEDISGPTAPISQLSIQITETVPHTLDKHIESVYGVTFSHNGLLLASGSADGTVRLWDMESEQEFSPLRHDDWINGLAFSPNDYILASACADRIVYLWEWKKNHPLKQLEGHAGWVNDVTFSPDGELLASASHDGTVRLWEVKRGILLRMLEGHTRWTTSVAFNPDGKILASGSYDHTVRLWDVERGQELKEWSIKHENWVNDVAFNSTGEWLASASADQTVRLWNVSNGQQVHKLEHPGWVNGVAFRPDGRILASACADQKVRLWNVTSGEMVQMLDLSSGDIVQTLSDHTSTVWSVAFSHDGSFLASASADKKVRLWSIK
jgi:WD40 repeat protein/predicted Ser/Thr protein kinase